MNRDQLIEAMAKAIIVDCGCDVNDHSLALTYSNAEAALTAIEAQGMAIVPVEARSKDVPTAVIWTDKPEPAWVYNTMVKELRI